MTLFILYNVVNTYGKNTWNNMIEKGKLKQNKIPYYCTHGEYLVLVQEFA